MARPTQRPARGRDESRREGADREQEKDRDEEDREDRVRDEDERDERDQDEEDRDESDEAEAEASDDGDEEETSPEPQRAQRGRDAGGRNGKGGDPGNGRGASRSRLSGAQAVRAAKEYLIELTGREPEAVSGLERNPDGWSVTLEVVEMERIPQTTDVMGSFRVQLDGEGELAGCTRVRRYYRNQALEE